MKPVIIFIARLFTLSLLVPLASQESIISASSIYNIVRQSDQIDYSRENVDLKMHSLINMNSPNDHFLDDFNRLAKINMNYSEIDKNQYTNESLPKMGIGNGALRFALELGALGAMGQWGYEQEKGDSRYALMVGIPLVAAGGWGIFNVPSDPSRGQDGLVQVSGINRLLIESVFFGFAIWTLQDLGKESKAIGFGSTVIFHYALSLDRLKWLIKQ